MQYRRYRKGDGNEAPLQGKEVEACGDRREGQVGIFYGGVPIQDFGFGFNLKYPDLRQYAALTKIS